VPRGFSYAITQFVKITRSSKCSLKFATGVKQKQLRQILKEYQRVTNIFIGHFWVLNKLPTKGELLKPIVDLPLAENEPSWLSARLRKVAAREALSMVTAVRKRWKGKPEKANKPTHRGNRMYVSSTIARLEDTADTTEFDAWLILDSLTPSKKRDRLRLYLPVRFHDHYNRLCGRGQRLNSYVITDSYVQFAFEIDTGEKHPKGKAIGIDTGINALASLDDGRQFGTDIKPIIGSIKRCQQGSKRQRQLRRSLRQRMDEVAKEVVSELHLRLVVVERLKKLNYKTRVKRRLTKNMRRSLGAWNYRYWLGRVESRCEDNRVVFRSVNPAHTSQRCPACGHTERGNRSGEVFLCRSCGHTDNADVNAAKNILDRFLSGPYGAGFKTPDLQVATPAGSM